MPIDGRALDASLRELRRASGLDISVGLIAEQLRHVVGAALAILHVDGVAVQLLDDEARVRPVAALGTLAASLEFAEQDLGVGPGIDGMRTGRPVAVPDLTVESSYAALSEALEDDGARAVLSVPIEVDGELAGNLNALDRRPHPWSSADIAAAAAFADVVGILLGLGAAMVHDAAGGGPPSVEQD